ncbi:MAG: NADPH-dependent F420 reductase [Leptospirales bacterium]
MKFGMLGTGMVGETIGSKLLELGHEVKMGSRKAHNEKALNWIKKEGGKASEGSFHDAAIFGEIVFNCTAGIHSLEALRAIGKDTLSGKILIDVSNPLDMERRGYLTYCNNESLGEKIQDFLPDTKVVKTFNTMWCGLMVNPRKIKEPHTNYISGNDRDAKLKVIGLLKTFGWRNEEILDLGDITGARAVEMFLPLWLRIYTSKGNVAFNLAIVEAKNENEHK